MSHHTLLLRGKSHIIVSCYKSPRSVPSRCNFLREDNTARFSSNTDTHFCSLDWVTVGLVSLSLEQIIHISKCLVQQGAFSVTGKRRKRPRRQIRRIGQQLRKYTEKSFRCHYLNSLSLSPTISQFTLPVSC